MLLALIAALLPASQARPPLPPAQQPAIVRRLVDALTRRDAGALAKLFPRIRTVSEGKRQSLDAREVVRLLAGCTVGDTRLSYGQRYEVKLSCPGRRPPTGRCETADLVIGVSDAPNPSVLIDNQRSYGPACGPIYAPPPPPQPR